MIIIQQWAISLKSFWLHAVQFCFLMLHSKSKPGALRYSESHMQIKFKLVLIIWVNLHFSAPRLWEGSSLAMKSKYVLSVTCKKSGTQEKSGNLLIQSDIRNVYCSTSFLKNWSIFCSANSHEMICLSNFIAKQWIVLSHIGWNVAWCLRTKDCLLSLKHNFFWHICNASVSNGKGSHRS